MKEIKSREIMSEFMFINLAFITDNYGKLKSKIKSLSVTNKIHITYV